ARSVAMGRSCSASEPICVLEGGLGNQSALLAFPRPLRGGRLPLFSQLDDERLALVVQPLALALAVLAPDGVLAEQRKRDRRVAVGNDGVGQNAGIHLAPAHGLGRRGAGESAPDDLIGRDLNEKIFPALRDAVPL